MPGRRIAKGAGGCCCGASGCTGQVCVTVTNTCGGGAVSGLTVTLSYHAGATVGTCTTDGFGRCCIPITADSFYDVTVTGTGAQTKTISNQHYTCTTNNVLMNVYTASTAGVTVTVSGCSNGVRGIGGYASVSVTGPGSFSGSVNSGGVFVFHPTVTGVYTISVSASRHVTQSSTVNVTALCTPYTKNFNLLPAPGYACGAATYSWPDGPYTKDLTLTDPSLGTFTISAVDQSVGSGWSLAFRITGYAAHCNCPEGGGCLHNVDMKFEWNGGGGYIRVSGYQRACIAHSCPYTSIASFCSMIPVSSTDTVYPLNATTTYTQCNCDTFTSLCIGKTGYDFCDGLRKLWPGTGNFTQTLTE